MALLGVAIEHRHSAYSDAIATALVFLRLVPVSYTHLDVYKRQGLPSLKSRWQEAWKFPADDARFAVRDQPAEPAGMNTCAACHSRRSTLSEDRKAGEALENTHRLALPLAPNYHADGQQREEVYVWTSFLQSKMHQSGAVSYTHLDVYKRQVPDTATG